jgi:wyosine [tRNA(Phe)-imidazoG37] synthetase (radical SAM superfamily)
MGWMTKAGALSKIPDMVVRNRFAFNFDGTPLEARGLSFSQKANLIKAGIDMVLRGERALALPAAIQIEPTNVCNLRCPVCPTGSGQSKRPKGFMSMETFNRILDEIGDSLTFAILYGWGEPFLNRDLPRMISACTARNIRTLSSTNGHCLQTVEEALSVVDAGLSALIVALDGSTQEVYDTYRKGGSVEQVKRCVESIEEAKARRGAVLPYTNLRVVVTSNNQSDLPNVARFAREIGVNMYSCKTLGCLTVSEDFGSFEPQRQELRRFTYDGAERRLGAPARCPYPFRQPTVFWDGTLVSCEFDYNLEFPYGSCDIPRLWNGPRAKQMRRVIREGGPRPRFCAACPYRGRQQEGSVLRWTELRPLGASSRGQQIG